MWSAVLAPRLPFLARLAMLPRGSTHYGIRRSVPFAQLFCFALNIVPPLSIPKDAGRQLLVLDSADDDGGQIARIALTMKLTALARHILVLKLWRPHKICDFNH